MYSDFFDPPPAPYIKGGPKGKGKADDRSKGKKGKGVGVVAPAPPALKSPSKKSDAQAPVPSTSTSTLKLKRSVRFSDKVKVKTIAARGSAFEKMVEKVGWAKAEAMLGDIQIDAEAGAGEEEEEGGEEEEDDGMPLEDDEDVEMEDGEDDDEEEEDEEDDGEDGEEEEEEESDDEEGRETIERLKSSLFDEEDEQEDADASPGKSIPSFLSLTGNFNNRELTSSFDHFSRFPFSTRTTPPRPLFSDRFSGSGERGSQRLGYEGRSESEGSSC